MNAQKIQLPGHGLLLVVALFLLQLTPVAAQTKSEAPRNPDGSVMLPGEILVGEIKAASWSDRSALRAKLQAAEASFNQRLPEWETKKNALPEKERIAAEADFKSLVRQRGILRQKIEAVDDATADTWNSAKSELTSVLQTTIQIFKKLSARFDS
jgi:hypothetical protein